MRIPAIGWLLAGAVCALIAGCASGPTYSPETFMTAREAFPTPATLPDQASAQATRTSVYNAAFEDVYRAANVSASQAQFHIDGEQKSAGHILASRSLRMVPKNVNLDSSTEHMYFYSIVVRELGPKSTEVRISVKVQGKCIMLGAGRRAALGVFSLGLTEALNMSGNQQTNCTALSSGTWAARDYSNSEDMLRFLTFVRNNLLAAGAL